MSNIIFVTNMEPHYTGCREAFHKLAEENEISLDLVMFRQADDSETWNKSWEKLFTQSDFVLFTWMGTGLMMFWTKELLMTTGIRSIDIFRMEACRILRIYSDGFWRAFPASHVCGRLRNRCPGPEFFTRPCQTRISVCQNI